MRNGGSGLDGVSPYRWRDWLVGRESPRAQTSRSPSECPNDVPTYFDIRLIAPLPWSIGSLVILIFRRSNAKRWIRARRSLALPVEGEAGRARVPSSPNISFAVRLPKRRPYLLRD